MWRRGTVVARLLARRHVIDPPSTQCLPSTSRADVYCGSVNQNLTSVLIRCLSSAASVTGDITPEIAEIAEEPVKKKRGRKPKKVVTDDDRAALLTIGGANPSSSGFGEATEKESTKKGEREWEKYLLYILAKEFQGENKRYVAVQSGRLEHALLIRYAVERDGQALVALLLNHARRTGGKQRITPEEDEMLSVGFLLLARHFATDSANGNVNYSPALFYSTANLLDAMKKYGTDSGTAATHLLMRVEDWLKHRVEDVHTPNLEKTLESVRRNLARRVEYLNVNNSKILISTEEKQRIRDKVYQMTERHAERAQTREDNGYIADLHLVDHLREPFPESEYLGNPFSLPYLDKEAYLQRFAKHMEMEQSTWLRVKNVCRPKDSSPVTAEALISTWNWQDRIEKELLEKLESMPRNAVRGFLSVVGIKSAAKCVFESVLQILSSGQNLIPHATFVIDLTSPLLGMVHRCFVAELGIDEKQLWSKVFADYAHYVTDPDVSRLHSHRVWWEKCCRRHGLQPDMTMPFRQFPADSRRLLGVFLFDVIEKACQFPVKKVKKYQTEGAESAFSLRNVAIEEESQVNEEGKASVVKMVKVNGQLSELLDEHQFEHILFPTTQLPMLVPPRPWLDGGKGGPEYTRQVDVIRRITDFRRIDINREMQIRLGKGQARPVWDALNQLGCTPWTINEPMLKVLTEAFSMSPDPSKGELLDKLSVPRHSNTVVVPTYQERFGFVKSEEIDKEQWRQYAKDKAAAVKQRNEFNSLWCWMLYRIVLSHHFRGETLFFPHNMDFRGRVYPVSPHLSHMGDDVNRCMLKFAKGRPLGPDGLRWLKLHVINLTGKLKRRSIEERLRAVEELLTEIIDSAENPLNGKGWWIDSDDPWQTLAACMELRDAMNYPGDPAEFVSHLAVHQDGSCNGLQHYAALGRDKQGGEEVNLLPSELPADVYSSVAVRVEQKRLEDENSSDPAVRDLALLLREALPQAVPRKVIKQTVMTTVYGVTMYGAVLQIKRQLKALDIDGDNVGRFASYLAQKTFASLHDAFTSSMQLKDWFRVCAKGVGSLYRTTEWVTPLGLPVVQPYLRVKEKNGKLVMLPVTTKQVDAFPPNLVHSLDSTHMMLTSLECSRRGVTFAAVHDCFWTHAATVETMNEICRDMFIKLHKEPIVEQCGAELRDRYLPNGVLTRMSEKDRAHYTKLFTPQVKMGELDIEEVGKSVYFFS